MLKSRKLPRASGLDVLRSERGVRDAKVAGAVHRGKVVEIDVHIGDVIVPRWTVSTALVVMEAFSTITPRRLAHCE